MIIMEYPRENLSAYPEEERVYALQRQVESLTRNLQIVLDSLEDGTESLSDSVSKEGYIKRETDPTVPSWAKASSKPTYTASEVGAMPSGTPIPEKTSDLTNDSDFITLADVVGYTEMPIVGYTSQNEKTWEYVGISITVPQNHVYIVQAQQAYGDTKPLGIGFHGSNTVASYLQRPAYSISSDPSNENCGMGTFLLTPRTWYLFGKANTANKTNNYYVRYVDIKVG